MIPPGLIIQLWSSNFLTLTVDHPAGRNVGYQSKGYDKVKLHGVEGGAVQRGVQRREGYTEERGTGRV